MMFALTGCKAKPDEIKETVIEYVEDVTTIYFPYYVYNKDFEGYEYNVYFNEELMYQDDYSYIGEIKTSIGTSRYDAIEFFIENNGKFNYYGTW